MTYWTKRAEEMEKLLLDTSVDELNNHLAIVYKRAIRENMKEMKALLYDLGPDAKINDLYRYNRFWQIQSDLNTKLTALGHQQIKIMDKDLVNMYYKVQDYFNKNPKYLAITKPGINSRTKKIVELSLSPTDLSSPIVSNRANEVVNSIWVADSNRTWSDSVWMDKANLQKDLETAIVDIVSRGKGIDDVADRIMKHA